MLHAHFTPPRFSLNATALAALLLAHSHAQAATVNLAGPLFDASTIKTINRDLYKQYHGACADRDERKLDSVLATFETIRPSVVRVTVTNPTSCDVELQTGFASVSQPDFGKRYGALYEFSTQFKILSSKKNSGSAETVPAHVSLSINGDKVGGGYLTTLGYTRSGFWPTSPQTLTTSLRYSGQQYSQGGSLQSVGALFPVLSLVAAANSTLVVEVSGMTFSETHEASSTSPFQLWGLPSAQMVVAPGKPVKFSVGFLATPELAAADKGTSTIELVQNGVVVGRKTRAVRTSLGSQANLSGLDYDGFVLVAPQAPGTYSIRYTPGITGLSARSALQKQGSSYTLGTLTVSSQAGMFVGQHFHRHSQDRTAKYPGPIGHGYNLVRSHNSSTPLATFPDATYLPGVPPFTGSAYWGHGDTSTLPTAMPKLAELQAWADRYKPTASSNASHVLLTFASTPRQFSSTYDAATPRSGNYQYPWELSLPKLGTSTERAAFEQFVSQALQTLTGKVVAVQCWNEPDSPDISLHREETLERLADTCASIHRAVKAHDPKMLTVCPSAMRLENLQSILSAPLPAASPLRAAGKTRMVDFCDVASVHSYNYAGLKSDGSSHAMGRTVDLISAAHDVLASRLNVARALAVTEIGFSDAEETGWVGQVMSARSSSERAEVVYQTMADLGAMGVSLPVWYSYEGASSDAPKGYLGNVVSVQDAKVNFDSIVMAALNRATSEFGRTPGTAMPALALEANHTSDVSQVLTTAPMTAVNFLLSVANPTTAAAKNASLTATLSSPALLMDAVTLQTTVGAIAAPGSCSVSVISGKRTARCTLSDLPPGKTVQVLVKANLDTTTSAVQNMRTGSSFGVNLLGSVSWLRGNETRTAKSTGKSVLVRKP